MKKKEPTIEEEIQQTLACMDLIDRVEENPYFDTRLKQKLKNEEETINKLPPILKPIFSL